MGKIPGGTQINAEVPSAKFPVPGSEYSVLCTQYLELKSGLIWVHLWLIIMFDENELWILSFYRTSEISGALFFGRLAKSMKPGDIQRDMTKHFSDEALHAWYWTSCIESLGAQPLKLNEAYQDQYLITAGMPANLMEVLAITQIFEKRVINQYARHSQIPNIQPVVRETLNRIMDDEKWHIQWIREALRKIESEYGKDLIEATLKRFWEADQEVYQKTLKEHEERIQYLYLPQRHKGHKFSWQ